MKALLLLLALLGTQEPEVEVFRGVTAPPLPDDVTPRELVSRFVQSDWLTVRQAEWYLESRQEKGVPELLALLDRDEVVKLANTMDLIYPGAETFYGHGTINPYDLDYLPARAGCRAPDEGKSAAKAVETFPTRERHPPQATGTAGRLSPGQPWRSQRQARRRYRFQSSHRLTGSNHTLGDVQRGWTAEPHRPPQRRPAVPVVSEKVSLRPGTFDLFNPAGDFLEGRW